MSKFTKLAEELFIAALEEDYKNEVHPANQQFWKDLPKNKEHSLGRHPVFTLGGKDLDKDSYGHTRELVKRHRVNHNEMQGLFFEMMRKEQAHKSALEKLAIKAVANLMEVDESELKAKLTNDVDVNETEPLDPEEISSLPQHLLDEANKRITSNAFAQGASVHSYLTAHFLDQIEKEIKKIDPSLIDIYSKMASGSHHLYWLMDMSEMNLGGAAVGSVKPEQEKDEIKMVAKSPVFIVLVQELVKGVLELRYLKQLQEKSKEELSDEDIKKVYQYADKIEDEPRLIQIGPELWRRFLKVVNGSALKNKKKLMEIYAAVMKLHPTELHEFVQHVVSDPKKAIAKINTLFDDDFKENEPNIDDEIQNLIDSLD